MHSVLSFKDGSYYDDHSFANTMNVTQNVDGVVTAVDVITYR